MEAQQSPAGPRGSLPPKLGSVPQDASSCETHTRCPFPCIQQGQVGTPGPAGAPEQEGWGNREVAIAMETRQSGYGWKACGLGHLVQALLRSKGSIPHPCPSGALAWSEDSQGVVPACGLRPESWARWVL